MFKREMKKAEGLIKSTNSNMDWELNENVKVSWVEELYKENESDPWKVVNCTNHKVNNTPVTRFAVDLQNNYIHLNNAELR